MVVNDLRCELLPWDSEFFDLRIGRVTGERADDEAFATVDRWRRAESLQCIYWLVDPGDAVTLRTVEKNGLQLVDLRVDLVRRTTAELPPGVAVGGSPRRAAEGDVAELKKIARDAHRDSRFFFDERFDADRAGDLFETWIEKSCRGWADDVYVLGPEGSPVGYVTCHRQGDAGRIGLFAIAERARGRGLAAVLIGAALEAFRRGGAATVRVATQGRNAAAQRAYQRAGFVTDSIALWYHWWPPGNEAAGGAAS